MNENEKARLRAIVHSPHYQYSAVQRQMARDFLVRLSNEATR